jgi:hypothetical protein
MWRITSKKSLQEVLIMVIRANRQNDADEADLTPLVAAVKKEVQDFLEGDDLVELLRLAKYMFVAGRLSHKDEARQL